MRTYFAASRQRHGSPRILRDPDDDGECVSRKRGVRLMQAEGVVARVRKRFKRITMSDHDKPVAANVLDRQFVAAAPTRPRIGVTTEFVIGSGGAVNIQHPTLKVLQLALKRGCPDAGLSHHPDQGCS